MRKRNKTIAIRCTEDEYNRMHRRAREHGMKLSDFVLRTALGKKIIIAEGLQDVVKQQRAIGNNLNQLTRLVNQGEVNNALSDPAFFIPESLHDLIVTYINSSVVEIVQEDVTGLELHIGREDLPARCPEAVTHIARVGGSVGVGSR